MAHRKTITTSLLILAVALSSWIHDSTSYFTGYQYVLSQDEYFPFKYTRSYEEADSIYTTIYKIYDPSRGYHSRTVTATHYKSQKLIKVVVENPKGGVFKHINTEQMSYDSASLQSFGISGSIRTLGGERVPNQLEVKFVSARFENVKVGSVYATSTGSSDFYFYVLDKM